MKYESGAGGMAAAAIVVVGNKTHKHSGRVGFIPVFVPAQADRLTINSDDVQHTFYDLLVAHDVGMR